jgi:hypothetical protein
VLTKCAEHLGLHFPVDDQQNKQTGRSQMIISNKKERSVTVPDTTYGFLNDAHAKHSHAKLALICNFKDEGRFTGTVFAVA